MCNLCSEFVEKSVQRVLNRAQQREIMSPVKQHRRCRKLYHIMLLLTGKRSECKQIRNIILRQTATTSTPTLQHFTCIITAFASKLNNLRTDLSYIIQKTLKSNLINRGTKRNSCSVKCPLACFCYKAINEFLRNFVRIVYNEEKKQLLRFMHKCEDNVKCTLNILQEPKWTFCEKFFSSVHLLNGSTSSFRNAVICSYNTGRWIQSKNLPVPNGLTTVLSVCKIEKNFNEKTVSLMTYESLVVRHTSVTLK